MLVTKTVHELQEIYKTYNIKQSKNKEGYTNKILVCSELIHRKNDTVQQMVYLLKKTRCKEKSPMYDIYKTYFNMIDLVDQQFKLLEYSHRIGD